jgi:hypothetical protein
MKLVKGHPNVVTLYEVIEDRDNFQTYMVLGVWIRAGGGNRGVGIWIGQLYKRLHASDRTVNNVGYLQNCI